MIGLKLDKVRPLHLDLFRQSTGIGALFVRLAEHFVMKVAKPL
ncbi:hypothetical protein P873_08145 [Arenimonas composti TR7-09 = DSM 18010]|uniref:Uncharacterized protein n=1 Tax=Arenimonas composti TR7-09 = DSM 18010 TaxID=1121013 RepID=A0A091C0H6_9GAMM|nr:hypothetical protein P873_08145 [Arenimonas composti TR7-09 = DSM 18010]